MKILVPVKRVPHHDLPVRLLADGSAIDPATLRMVVNPFDEVALEEALRLRERGIASEVVAISCGTSASKQTLRTALAMGADRAILVDTEVEFPSLTTAKLFAAIVRQENISLVMCGKQATDSDAGEVGAMLAGLLGWGQATAVSSLQISGELVTATTEIDGGQEIISLHLPAVLTADLCLNQPRYLTLQGSMAAVKKSIDTTTPQVLNVPINTGLSILHLSEPPPRKASVRVTDVHELIRRLHSEAEVL